MTFYHAQDAQYQVHRGGLLLPSRADARAEPMPELGGTYGLTARLMADWVDP